MQQQTASLREVTRNPYNAETPLPALLDDVTSAGLVYVRNHFDMPRTDAPVWTVTVDGAVARPASLALPDIHALPAKRLVVTMECAGNGRTSLRPAPKGTPWGYGAVSTIRVTGTPVAGLLEQAGVSDRTVEVLFTGADRGEPVPGRAMQYARSLPLAVAMHPDTLLAWELNGRPLSREHGHPLRLVMPGFYGMASVKWVTGIRALTEPFDGYFQREQYVYLDEAGTPQGEPARHMRVRSIIARPLDGARLKRGAIEIEGVAWSGHGPVVKVEFSADGGTRWADAALGPQASPYRAQRWRFTWTPAAAGQYTFISRATDSKGNTQPLGQRWNRLGYGNNGTQHITVRVE